MRILIVSQYFWPEDFRINDLALSLKADLQYEVTVLTGLPNYPQGHLFSGYDFWDPKQEMWHGIEIIRIPLIPRGKKSKLRLGLNYLSFCIFACLCGPYRCRKKYDVIFVAQYSPVTVALPAILIKKVKKIPLLLWVQDLWPESLSATGAIRLPVVLRAVGRLVSYIYNRSDRILVQSKAFVPRIRGLDTNLVKVDYLPNWAETLYHPCRPNIEWNEDKGLPVGFRLMFAGNIGKAQDFPTILSAAERLRDHGDIHWVILGDGRERLWVEKEIIERNLSNVVHVMGRYPIEDMPLFFTAADVMLVTLKRAPIFALTIPSKIQSYLACGRPIIAALDGEGRRVVEEAGAGFGCPAESPTELAELVLKMFYMQIADREKMGRDGRRYYEKNFARSFLINKLDKILKKEVYHE